MSEKHLRNFVRLSLQEESNNEMMKNLPSVEIMQRVSKLPGAGIVIVRKFNQRWRVLGLSLNDVLDIPKGVIESGEKPLQTAIRETQEEAGLTDIFFEWGMDSVRISQLTVYVASTNQDPIITQNPETGIYEHQGFVWSSWDEMRAGAYPYLQPAIDWARDVVEGLQSTPDCP
jgi:bis(5'-nucleosidyl)-tetraphosphatase